MNKQARLTAAALAALAMGGCAGAGGGIAGGGAGSAPMGFRKFGPGGQPAANVTGECWGVNECKGKGACGGVGHECAGGNACKGQGWLSLTKSDCDAKKGKFKAG